MSNFHTKFKKIIGKQGILWENLVIAGQEQRFQRF